MALAPSGDLRLFGIDLGQWPRQWQSAAAWLLARPALRALTPAVRVRLHQADGALSLWSVQRDDALALPMQAGAPQAEAVELPRDEALERVLMLPALAQADLDEAVRLEALSISPFVPEQTVFGYRVGASGEGRVRVDLALTSRARLEALLRRHVRLAQPEVWLLPAGRLEAARTHVGTMLRPVFMPTGSVGMADVPPRLKLAARGRHLRLALLALAVCLLLALVVTPTLQLRQRALAAQTALERLNAQATEQLAAREALQQHADRLALLQAATGEQLRLMPALALLTRALPKSAWISSLRLASGKLLISGFAENAAALS